MTIIDTHAHLASSEFNRDREEVVQRARLQGVTFLEVGADLPSAGLVLQIARRYSVPCSLGIHPHSAADAPGVEEAWRRIEALVDENSDIVVAIGEIGLDYYRNLSPKDLQIRSFEIGLDLAKRKRLPAIIHEREARSDTLSVLKRAGLDHDVIFHCFGGDLAYARKCLDLGAYLGLGGVLTYPKNEELREAVRYVPIDRILLETDCPYLPPQSRRGQRNEPAYVVETLDKMALVTGRSKEEVAFVTSANARRAMRVEDQRSFWVWV